MHIKLSRSQYVVWFYDNEKRSITKIIPIKFINKISVSLGRSKLFSLSSIFNIIKVVNFDLVLVIILKNRFHTKLYFSISFGTPKQH